MRVIFGAAIAGVGVSALIFQRKGDPEPWKCYFDTPQSYIGVADTSNDGRKCMSWAEASEHEQLSGFFGGFTGGAPAEKLDGNFCRAFTAGDAKPWCFVMGFTSADTAKQDCDVPQCPTDGPWAIDYHDETKDAVVPCTDTEGVPQEECECSCASAGGRAFIEIMHPKTAAPVVCHCAA